jgi:NADH-quinone oxidoreductase subunit N
MLALLGFPVFGGMGFVAKWYMIEAALKAQYMGMPTPQVNLAIVIVLTSVISAGFYLRLVTIMFMRTRAAAPARPRAVRAGGLTESVVIVSVVLLLALGIMPSYLVTWSQRSIPLVNAHPEYSIPSSGQTAP